MNTFWVIERFENGKSQGYWAGDSSRDFITEIDNAIHFCRRDDAWRIKRGWHWQDTQVTEHAYLDSAPSPAQGTPEPPINGERWLARRGFADIRNYSSTELGPLLEAYRNETALAGPQNGQGWDEENYVAWCRYAHNSAGETNGIRLCDSDAPGAFKVYRLPAPPTGDAPTEKK
jgi:hypothetical protein